MLNGRIVAVILFIGCFLAGAGWAQGQTPTLEDSWSDFLHYTKIGRFDLAKGHANAILGSNPDPVLLFEYSQQNQPGYELALRVAETAHDEELAGLTEQLLKLIEQGRFQRRTDPQLIVQEIRRLNTTPRGKRMATQRLKDAGEFAVPYLLDAMGELMRSSSADSGLSELIEVLPQISRPAIRSLGAALQMKNEALKAEIIRAMGLIGYPQSLPYLKYVAEKDASLELRDLALQSIRQIDPRGVNVPAAALFFQLAERYYFHDESLAPQEDAPLANVWFWDAENRRLTREEVAPGYFHELMSMRCCEWSLKSEEQFGLAIGLWLAAFFKAEATGEPMPQYFGQTHANAEVYATTAGPEYLHQALARALSAKEAPVALGAVEALGRTAGEKSLMYTLGPAQPLLSALSFEDRAVRYSAAIAIANAGPREGFNESGLVVENLAEALGQTNQQAAAAAGQWSPELADEYALRAAEAMLKVAVSRNPVIDLSLGQAALIAATNDSRQPIQVLAGQVLAYLKSPNAQRAIAAMALAAANDMNVRIEAFASLANSAKLNGNMLPDDMIGAIYALTSSGQTPPDLRAAAAAAYGALNLPSQKVKNLILDQAKS